MNWFLTLIAFDKKENAVSMQPGVGVFGRAKTNYIIAKHVHSRRCSRSRLLVSRSFYSGPSVACLVRMRNDVLLLHSWDSIIYSDHEHHFKSPWPWDVNRTRGKSHSLITFVDLGCARLTI